MNHSTKPIMLTPKGSQASDLMPQDTRPHSPQTRNNDFFALPLELRTAIYEYYFSYEHPRNPRPSNLPYPNPLPNQIKATPKTDPPEKRKFQSILARKLPLLWSTKAILHEALPVLYRCHTFRVHIPCYQRYQRWERQGWYYDRRTRNPKNRTSPSRLQQLDTLKPAGRFITSLEIIETATVERGAWDERSIPGLGGLWNDFPNLRVLRLNVRVEYASWYSEDEGNGGVLMELWGGGLQCLEICVKCCGDEGGWFREAIAPERCWEMKIPAVYVGWEGLMVSVWVLRRSSLPEEVLRWLD